MWGDYVEDSISDISYLLSDGELPFNNNSLLRIKNLSTGYML